MEPIARKGDSVRGHYDVQGNEVVGTITTTQSTVRNGGLEIATTDSIITIPPHPHQLTPGPSDIRGHTWRVVGTGKHKIEGEFIARDGDGGNDDDWDGFQTMPSASYIEATSSDLQSA